MQFNRERRNFFDDLQSKFKKENINGNIIDRYSSLSNILNSNDI